MRLKISARKSDLARLQAYTVGETLQKKIENLEIEYRFKESLGDINLHDPLWKIPEKGVFTEDFFGELISGETDMVVHSWKDLPTEGKSETFIAATLPRADQRDLLLFKKSSFASVKESRHLKVFSSSPRRSHNLTPFLKSHFPWGLDNVSFESVRGNIPTRIRKLLESPETDALILAKAALDRLLAAPQAEFAEVQALLRKYLESLEWMVLPLSINPNAAAQGALAIEIRKDRQDLIELFQRIHHADTAAMAQAERDCLSEHGGGCHQKIGISFLKRPYGVVKVLKGLTSAGVVLDECRILQTNTPRFAASEMWSDKGQEAFFERTPLFPEIPEGKAIFVAKAEAAHQALPRHSLLWTAGLKTWEKLAAKGYWVHGSSESLGEQENPMAEVLAPKKLDWVKLSHANGLQNDMPVIESYQLQRSQTPFNFQGKKAFFWSSGSLFLAAIKEHPEVLTAHHASGPGNTAKIIREALQEAGLDANTRHHIFLSEDSWRNECQA